ncbi:MAG: YjbQ family protein [Deltaproteobacteria bacterium]|nr:YjbQ family protein [Deltaproteobacteria bacterium]MBN2688400.1 YjbQ family protein [Deltaproteobacteria bacterium]
MKIKNISLAFRTTGETDLLDITGNIADEIARSGVTEGQVVLFVPGSTASLTTIEYERGVIEDLRDAIERLAPRVMRYRHDERWGDGNGYSHVRAALLGPSLAVPIMQGRLTLGTWQQIILIDFDNRPRHRRIIGQVLGK